MEARIVNPQFGNKIKLRNMKKQNCDLNQDGIMFEKAP